MNYRNIAIGMIEESFAEYKGWDEGPISDFLNMYDIPVWDNMSDNTKQAALEYVYYNRYDIKLHSGYVDSWVQATVYFMLYHFAERMCPEGEPDLEMFFDDLDFMMEDDILQDRYIQETLGISPTFTEKF